MDAPTPYNKQFEFVHSITEDPNIIDYAKMSILFAFSEYPYDDYEKCRLIVEKFEEKYGPTWSCSLIEKGSQFCQYFTYFLEINYENYKIFIWKSA